MKKVSASMLLLAMLLMAIMPNKTFAAANKDMRAVWISTVYNLDYPSVSYRNNEAAQKSQYTQILDTLKTLGINAVVVQVRPKADALYKSAINPWSDVLTGTQGKDPGYDPMAFMIEEAHKRGMEFHAWLNPYRVTTSGTNVNALSSNHPARLNPSWVFSYNNALYYNPELEEVKQHIVDTVTEIAENYNIDGIHFDDYYYPSSYPLPSGETADGTVANARRDAVSDMISRVHQAVKGVNSTYGKSVAFGVSPAGIWKNRANDANGSNTSGNQSYYSVYADTRKWVKNNWVDYIVPQIYWQTGHAKADYETLVSWWSNQVLGTNVTLYIGQGIYNNSVAKQIDTQLHINKKYSNVKGSFFFSLRDILNNRMNCKTKIKDFYVGASNSTNTSTGISNSTPEYLPEVIKPESSTASKTGIVTADSLNVRSGASTTKEVIASITKNTKVTILDTLGNWYKVKLGDGTVGWVSSTYISTANIGTTPTAGAVSITTTFPKQGTVTADSLNVRAGARTDREIVAKVSSGTKVTVLSSQGNWYKVKLATGKIGWASSTYIKL